MQATACVGSLQCSVVRVNRLGVTAVPANASYRHVLLLVSATACWGCGTVLSKEALERDVAPLSLLVVELAASSLLLLVCVFVFARPRTAPPSLGALSALGLLNPGLAYALGLWGLVSISASMSVLMWAAEPTLILLAAALLLRERLSLWTTGLVATASVGVLLVTYKPGSSGDGQGIALTLAAVTACALYTVLTRRLLLDDGPTVVVLAQQLAALGFALVLAGGAALAGVADLGFPDGAATWLLAASSGIVYYGLAFWFFVSGLRHVPASTAGAFLPLIPVFGLIAGAMTGDRLIGRGWIGAALIVLATLTVGVREVRLRAKASPAGV